MLRKSCSWLLLAIAGCGLVLCSSAVAQQQKDSSDRQSNSRRYTVGRQVQSGADTDGSIARLLGNMNKAEVELTQYAEDRADVDAVNRFARKQNRQHSVNLEELQQFAPDAGTGIGRAAKDDNRTNNADQDHSKTLDWRQVSQEIANENLRMAKKELRDREGLDFDWAFVGQQKLLHDALCANMTVLRRYASPQLQQVIDNQLADAKQDQSTLENLMGQLKQEEQRRAASGRQRPDRGNSTAAYTTKGRSNGGQPYADEFEFAETDFTTMAKLTDGPNGRPSLGVQLDSRMNDRASVAQVRSGSPADKAGLQPGDIILAVNGREINSPDDLVREVSRLAAGDRVQLIVDRSFSNERTIPLGGRNDSDRQNSSRSNRQPASQQRGQSRDEDNTTY